MRGRNRRHYEYEGLRWSLCWSVTTWSKRSPGSQVPNEESFAKDRVRCRRRVCLADGDAKGPHPKRNGLVELLEAESVRERFLLILGGPRVTHELAKELGCDAGFGPGKYADDVASYFVTELDKRRQAE